MQRAMARQAEAEREKRAKIIHAEGELQASEKLSQAAVVIAQEPVTVTLRYLQTLTEIASEKNSTIIFPLPIELMNMLGVRDKAIARGQNRDRAFTDVADDGFHEIQLSGKQLVFLFMATTVVSVVIFLCGVLVGRGVRGDTVNAAQRRAVATPPRPRRRRRAPPGDHAPAADPATTAADLSRIRQARQARSRPLRTVEGRNRPDSARGTEACSTRVRDDNAACDGAACRGIAGCPCAARSSHRRRTTPAAPQPRRPRRAPGSGPCRSSR